MSFAFPKEQRLRQRERIAALSSKGVSLFKYPIKAYYLPGKTTVSRYAIAVPKKNFKRAVKRNLLKRRLREALRLNQAECLGGACGDFLFVYITKDICPYDVIEAAVCEILRKSAQQ
jgi:ribonuclease P protein component